jgi:hypothetical protein
VVGHGASEFGTIRDRSRIDEPAARADQPKPMSRGYRDERALPGDEGA